MTGILDRLTGRKPAAVDPREELDPGRLHPPLAEAKDLGTQLAERGRDLMAQIKPLMAERERLVTAHGERLLAAELAGQPLDTDAIEGHERDLAALDKQLGRLSGQMDAVAKAIPQHEAVIADRQKEAAELVRAGARELAAPIAAEVRAALRTLQAAKGREIALRETERNTLEALGRRGGGLPWIMPTWLDLDEPVIRAWEREMTAAGFDFPDAAG